MAATKTYKTPGVYVAELAAFPPSVVGVETAVPAFIGYTEKAEIDGKPVLLEPIKITSMADYETIFGRGYPPEYNIIEATEDQVTEGAYDFKVYDPNDSKWKYYNLDSTVDTRFTLYTSMKLFYDNGGGNCYIVSVGYYEDTAAVSKDDLIAGLATTAEQQGPTMLVIPDATLLAPDEVGGFVSADFKEVTRDMIKQCGELQDRVAVLDVYGSQHAKKENWEEIIANFRIDVGESYLSYGMSYFPFLDTSVVDAGDFTYLNVSDGGVALSEVLTWENVNVNNGGVVPTGVEDSSKQYLEVQANIDLMGTTDAGDVDAVTKLNQNLVAALSLLGNIETVMAKKNSILPPSAAMAGAYTFTDDTKGVWNAPANLVLSSVNRPTFKIDSKQQESLNMPVDGKAVDAIRDFTGRGTVVWGARTLDGNSPDWRYIQVRRTLIYIEQSLKEAIDPYVFAANDGNTWTTVISMCSNFLQTLWSQGGLMGSSADEAFNVQCGLGSTMTAQDVLDGYMIVQVTLQMIRPAEFIELTFTQKMEG